ncbi:SDR family NAD(P)-dependent oxidoreductase [Paenibacillus kyungheensis]|uniref:SDR family NAD(P)-dependent oxidoreductase n=1 Tax=Paenibacillus kyungheensis TaxID=1452732 RepID=A0AAX3M7E5_9BACL|nr:SDR family NAD(P)-dependent oxidoreductase [Paenibacillus kyungheensis]WCT58030.1 SDR family NAD(P)-dependent oxidoreductase [Paenibacillus kyungheensis]
MNSIYQYVVEKTATGSINKAIGVEILKQLKREDNEKPHQDIAIIGIAIEMPNANDLDQFWSNLRQGIDCVAPFSEKRKADLQALWPMGQMSDAAPKYADGAYLSDIAHFDPSYFNISPVEAKLMDPQQRLFLQHAWRAIADAGYSEEQLSRSRTGVYVGFTGDFSESYQNFIAEVNPEQLPLSVTGNINSIIASRISYCLNLKGPAMLVDTACSSALVAVHLAALGMRNGDCEMAIAGGVKLNMLPLKDKLQSLDIASSTGKARTFDDESDGTGFGEGVAAILMKPLAKAQKDGDRIYAVIKGSAVNQDGSSIGITAPNALAQEDVIVRAWKNAGIDPETISYMEAHGTGTKLGDPIEIDGIAKAFSRFTDKKQFCAVGSIKTNIGHLDHLAGLAGLVKAVLAMQHAEIPPSLHFRRPNRNIRFESSPVFVSDRLIPWSVEHGPRRCGVSSFGLSGTNCHVVLEEAPPVKTEPATLDHLRVLTLSAESKEALIELVQSYRFYVGSKLYRNLDDLCYTANTGRGHYSHRLVLLFIDENKLQQQMLRLVQDEAWDVLEAEEIYYGENKVISAPKVNKRLGELTEDDKRQLTAKAHSLLESGEQLAALAKLYTSGADVAWSTLYRGHKYSKVQLPPVPFARKRFWVEAVTDKRKIEHVTHEQPLNSLIDKQLVDTMGLQVYASDFRLEERWVLSQHRIMGNGVVPGTTFIDMVRQLLLLDGSENESHFEQVTFLSPFIVSEGEVRQMHLSFENDKDTRLRFAIVSRGEDEKEWIEHCKGTVDLIKPQKNRTFPFRELLDRFASYETIEVEQGQGDIEFGPRWNNVRQIQVNKTEMLAHIELPEDFAADIYDHQLHPAMMDNAMNIAINQIGDGFYLPWMYKKLRVYGKMPQQFFSFVLLKQDVQPGGETAVFDVMLMDKHGRVFAEAEDYIIKRVNKDGESYQRLKSSDCFQLEWLPEPCVTDEPATSISGSVLLLGNHEADMQSLKARFGQEGCRVIEVELGQEFCERGPDQYISSAASNDFDRILQTADREQIGQIVYMLRTPEESDSYERLEDLRKKSADGLFLLIQSLLRHKLKQTLNLTLIASNAQNISNAESELQPLFSAFFGLGKVINEEYPDLHVRCIDVDEHISIDTLWEEMSFKPSTYCIGYRRNVRYAPKLVSLHKISTDVRPVPLKQEGFYLITGGLGGLGLEVGKHLAASLSGIKLVFMNRTALPPREIWARIIDDSVDEKTIRAIQALLEMERRGASVQSYSADVSKADELEAALCQLRAQYGKVNGIVHAAGVAGKGYLFQKQPLDFQSVMAPKVKGTWLLDKLTENEPPDFFVLFSSITALIGGVGQGDYTAANAYMDTFAAKRNQSGKRTLSINWPIWKETGMGVDYEIQDNGILQAIRTTSAMQMLDFLLPQSHANVIVGKWNQEAAGKRLIGSFLFGLSQELERKILKLASSRERTLQKENPYLYAEVEVHGKENYSEMEVKLAQIWSGILELEQINVYDSFYSLGGDSIIAVRLVSAMSDLLQVEIGVNDLLDLATIEALAGYIDKLPGQESTAKPNAVTKVASKQAPEELRAIVSDQASSLPDQTIISLDTFNQTQELSWRQFNCYDRGFAIQFGDENASLIPFFKLFLGLKRGYNLSAHGYPYSLQDQEKVFGYETDHQMLTKFGYALQQVNVGSESNFHETICQLVAQKKLVMVSFDEFYSFYTPYYRKEHTDHLTIINGYDRRKEIYHIVNHNHLQQQAVSTVSYGPFTTPFATLEEVYEAIPIELRTIIILDRLPDSIIHVESLRTELLHLLRILSVEGQAGSEIERMITWDGQSTESVDEKIRELYLKLGGKELFVDTLMRDFIEEPWQTEIEAAADVIITSSKQFITQFVTGIFRKRPVDIQDVIHFEAEVRDHTQQWLNLAITVLEQKWQKS